MSIPAVEAVNPTGASQQGFSPVEIEQFERDGYVVARGLADEAICDRMRQVSLDGLEREVGPVEYEADVHYPGAPSSYNAEGGKTVRRLKQAHSRDFVFTEWISAPKLTGRLHQLLGPEVVMPLSHHNCIMTKQPRYSSDTGWHQDSRYWSFEKPDLVSVWLALGPEFPGNGCLKLIPGTYSMSFDRHRLDEALFLRSDLPENRELIDRTVFAELDRGDVLFFHSRTFHAASRNSSNEPKLSAVFTFRSGDNQPIPGTRSASLPELLIPAVAVE